MNELIDQKELEAFIKGSELARVDVIDWEQIPGIYNKKSCYSPEQRISALTTWLLTGSLLKAATLSGVDYSAVRQWASTSEWWKEGIARIRKQKNDELDARITLMIDKTMDEIEERILLGDEVVHGPSGQKIRKKINGKDLTTMVAILYDKRALMRGDPTSMQGKATGAGVLADLKKDFEKLADDIQQRARDGKLEKVVNPEIDNGES